MATSSDAVRKFKDCCDVLTFRSIQSIATMANLAITLEGQDKLEAVAMQMEVLDKRLRIKTHTEYPRSPPFHSHPPPQRRLLQISLPSLSALCPAWCERCSLESVGASRAVPSCETCCKPPFSRFRKSAPFLEQPIFLPPCRPRKCGLCMIFGPSLRRPPAATERIK